MYRYNINIEIDKEEISGIQRAGATRGMKTVYTKMYCTWYATRVSLQRALLRRQSSKPIYHIARGSSLGGSWIHIYREKTKKWTEQNTKRKRKVLGGCGRNFVSASASIWTLNLPALNHADRRVSDCQGSHPAWVRPATQQHLLWHLSVDGGAERLQNSYRIDLVRFVSVWIGSVRLEIHISECRVVLWV